MSRRHATSFAIVSISLLAAGCGSNDQSALHASGKDAKDIATLWWVMFAGSVVVFAVVLVLVAVALLRRRTDRDTREPSRGGRSLAWVPVIGGIIVPAIVLAALFALTLGTLSSTSPA